MKFLSFLREPFILFLIAGTLLFVAYSSLDNYLNRNEYVLVVTDSDIAQLEQAWQSRMNRPPTPDERQALIDNYVQEQVLYKTALDMGLDRDDQVIKGRMVQKLKFLGNDLIRPPQPSEQDLVTYYEQNSDKYLPEESITITHIFFDPDKRDDETLTDADKALAEIAADADFDGDISRYGDRFMLQNYYPNRTEMEIRKLFGNGFTETVFQLEPGRWHGRVLSGYGTHLVYIHDHQKSELPAFQLVRDQVKADWMDDMQQKLNNRYIEGLMARYEIVFKEEA